jgi:hypothetical protein
MPVVATIARVAGPGRLAGYMWSCRSGSGQIVEVTKRGDPPANRRSGTNFVINTLIIPPRILAGADEVIEQARRHVCFWHLADMAFQPADVRFRG